MGATTSKKMKRQQLWSSIVAETNLFGDNCDELLFKTLNGNAESFVLRRHPFELERLTKTNHPDVYCLRRKPNHASVCEHELVLYGDQILPILPENKRGDQVSKSRRMQAYMWPICEIRIRTDLKEGERIVDASGARVAVANVYVGRKRSFLRLFGRYFVYKRHRANYLLMNSNHSGASSSSSSCK